MDSRSRLLCFCALALVTACSDGTGPGRESATDIALEQPVAGRLAAGETARYRFRAGAVVALAARVLVAQGTVSLRVTDSVAAQLVPAVPALGPDTAWKGTGYAHVASGTLLTVEVTAGTGGADYQVKLIGVRTTPETHTALLVADDTVDDEFLDDPNDVDVFDFVPQAGIEYVLFAQGPAQDVGVVPGVDIFRSDYPESWGTYSLDLNAADLEATRLYLAHAPVTYRFRVRGVRSTGTATAFQPVPYRLVVKRINFAPEKVPRLVVPNVTVSGEAIDHVGDVDDFAFYAAAGDEFNLFFQSLSSSPGTAFSAELYRGAVKLQGLTSGALLDTVLRSHVSGRFAPAGPDTFGIRVTAPDGAGGLPRGPYRFQLYRVNRAPEDVPATGFAIGGDVIGERIDDLGDVDEFTMTVPSDTFGVVYVWQPSATIRPGDADKALILTVLDPATGRVVGQSSGLAFGASDSAKGTGMMRLKAGAYTVRVEGAASHVAAFTGAYGIASGAFDTLPETRPALMAIGDTAVETIDPPADEDHYRFRGAKWQPVNMCLQFTGSADEGTFWAVVESPIPSEYFLFSVAAPGPSSSQCQYQTGRFTLPADTVYGVVVYLDPGGRLPRQHGQYRLAVLPYPVTPEAAAPDLVPGDSVTSERLDELGDVDEFRVTAPPGAELQTWIAGSGGLRVDALHAGTMDSVRSTVSYQAGAVLGRVTVPSDGQLRLRFYEPRLFGCGGDCGFHVVGPYSFWVRAVNRAPESLPAAIAVGDTVEGEALGYEGDIDEFVFSGAAGDTVQAYLQFPTGFLSYTGARLDVVAPDGSVLATVSGGNPTPTLETLSTGRFRLPVTGSYIVRIQGNDDRLGTGAYRFRLAR